jgi:hypothetical protein
VGLFQKAEFREGRNKLKNRRGHPTSWTLREETTTNKSPTRLSADLPIFKEMKMGREELIHE